MKFLAFVYFEIETRALTFKQGERARVLLLCLENRVTCAILEKISFERDFQLQNDFIISIGL